jgi:hypothetical protein
MDILVLFAQRKCRYNGEYAPEALEVISEHGNDENPDFMAEEYAKAVATGEFTSVQIIRMNIKDAVLDNALFPSVEATVV